MPLSLLPSLMPDPSLGLGGLFVSAFISATVAPGGSEAVLAYLAHQGLAPPGILLAVATLGNTLGSVTTWGLGYWAGLRFPADRPAEPRRHRAVESVRRYGWPILLLAWLPVVGDGLCFAAGWLRLDFPRSLAAIAVGKALRYAAVVWAVT